MECKRTVISRALGMIRIMWALVFITVLPSTTMCQITVASRAFSGVTSPTILPSSYAFGASYGALTGGVGNTPTYPYPALTSIVLLVYLQGGSALTVTDTNGDTFSLLASSTDSYSGNVYLYETLNMAISPSFINITYTGTSTYFSFTLVPLTGVASFGASAVSCGTGSSYSLPITTTQTLSTIISSILVTGTGLGSIPATPTDGGVLYRADTGTYGTESIVTKNAPSVGLATSTGTLPSSVRYCTGSVEAKSH
jgi:hypothetical protein